MKIVLSLDENNEKAIAFLNFIQTLDFISFEGKDNVPQWQKDRLDTYLKEHQNGTAEYTDWNSAKKALFDKFGA